MWVFLALSAKETGIVAIPLVLLALCLVPGPDGGPGRRVALPPVLGGMTIAFGVWLALRALAQGEVIGEVLVGASVSAYDGVGAVTRTPFVLLAHLQVLLTPWPPLLTRTLDGSTGMAILSTVVLVGAIAVAVRFRHRLSPSRVWFPAALVLLPLVPVSIYHRVVGSYEVADRYLYLPIAGVAVWVACSRLPWRWSLAPWLLVAVSAAGSWSATWNWRDGESLVRHSLTHCPDDPMLLAMAGELALNEAFAGDTQQIGVAEHYYRRSITGAAEAYGEQMRTCIAGSWLGLAWCRMLRRPSTPCQAKELILAFQRAVEVDPHNPMTWVGLAAAHLALREFAAAERVFARALEVDPSCVAAANGLDRARTACRAADRQR